MIGNLQAHYGFSRMPFGRELGVVTPEIQYPARPLKSEASGAPVPIPRDLALELAAPVKRRPSASGRVLADDSGAQISPQRIEAAIRAVRGRVPGLPPEFRLHDLRHHYASVLIASGANVKVVQARLRHASAVTTLDVYGHLFPDTDESTRAAGGLRSRSVLRTNCGPQPPSRS